MPGEHNSKQEGTIGDRAFEVLEESFGVTKRQTKSWRKSAWRYFKIAASMLISAIVMPFIVIPLGILVGPRGYEGLVVTPIAVLLCWAMILFFGLRRRVTPKRVARAPLSELPGKLSEFLETNSRHLPLSAKTSIEGIFQHLEEIEPVLYVLKEESPYAVRLRRLLTEDLMSIIDHYRRLPPRLRQQKLHGGATPEEQLASGLATIRDELGHVNEEIAKEDLYSLATKERYLDMKYGSKNKF